MPYVPETDPRFLGETEEERLEAKAQHQDRLQNKYEDLRIANEKLEVFKKRGWKHIEDVLRVQIAFAQEQILGGKAETLEQINKYRGKIEAFNITLRLPGDTKTSQENLTDAIKDLEEAAPE